MAFSKKYLLLILLLIINVAYALPNVEKATSWLANNTNFDQDVETVSYSVIALSLADEEGEAQQGVAKLIDRQDASGCWPKGNCRVKDTGLALLAVSQLGKSTSATRSWILSSRLPATSSGKFWVQIAASSDGICRVSYDGKSKSFTLKNGNIVECGNKPWIESTCIDPNLLKGSIEKKIDVDCSALQSSSIISLIYQLGESYYILDEQHTNIAKLTISNACLGTTKSSTSCDYDATLFATFAMRSLGQNIGTQTYLESNIQSSNTPGYSLLYALTKKEIYREILSQKQLSSGSFTNVFQTGLAMIALQGTTAGSNASAWLESQQSPDGSWNRNVKDTSVAVYGLLFQDFSSVGESCVGQGNLCCSACSLQGEDFKSLDNTCNVGQACCSKCEDVVLSTCQELGGTECSFSEKCVGGDFQQSSDSLYCCLGGTCKEIASTTSTVLPTCNYDNVCDLDETELSCPGDCKPKSNWLLYTFFVVILLGAAGGLYYLKKNGKLNFRFGRREKPSGMPTQRPVYPVSRPIVRQPVMQQRPQLSRKKQLKSSVEKELEKSLEEAKKLLKEDKK